MDPLTRPSRQLPNVVKHQIIIIIIIIMATIETAVPLNLPSSSIFDRESEITVNFDRDQRLRLKEQGYTAGLIHHIERASSEIAFHVWIVDNSASMSQIDRCRITKVPGNHHAVQKISRWEELTDTVLYHAHITQTLHAPTIVRLIHSYPNVPIEYELTSSSFHEQKDQGILHLKNSLQLIRPSTGRSLLVPAIHAISSRMTTLKESLRCNGQFISLVVATDSLPADENGSVGPEQGNLFIKAVQKLERYPIVLTIRLSSNEKQVRDFYDQLRSRVKIRIVILSDYVSEAQKVHEENNWINYILPLHRLREFGSASTCLDRACERLLSKVELYDFLIILFGYELINGYIDVSNWSDFIFPIKHALSQHSDQWDHVSRKDRPFIDVRALAKKYRPQRRRCIDHLVEIFR